MPALPQIRKRRHGVNDAPGDGELGDNSGYRLHLERNERLNWPLRLES